MKKIQHIATIGFLALAGLGAATGLKAFPNMASFSEDPASGSHPGGGHLFGTGGGKDWGITCAMCHINNANQQGMLTSQLTWVPALSAGKYVPGTAYVVTIKMLGEHLGMTGTTNVNGFAMTFEDVNGTPKGTILGESQTTCAPVPVPPIDGPLGNGGLTWTYQDPYVGNTCRTVASLDHFGSTGAKTSWNFKWTAPAAGSGTVYAYYGIVDGNSDQKSLGDDVKMGKLQINEGP
jgi:hypothetical protein